MTVLDLEGSVFDPTIVDVSTAPDGYLMSCEPRTDRLGSTFSVYESEFDIIPRSEWDQLIAEQEDNEFLVKEIKNQKQEGSCATNATTGSGETNWVYQFGLWIQFSPISIYRFVANGPNSGSTISDNLKHIRNVGVLPQDTALNREILTKAGVPLKMLQPTGYYQEFPDGWKDVAALFRWREYLDIASFDGLVSAIFRKRFPVYGRSGHAIYGVKVVKRNGGYYIKYANSWGVWGENGYGYDSESFISRAIGSYGAFAPSASFIPEFIQIFRKAA